MIEKLKQVAQHKKGVEVLFTLLILSFPFGSHFLSFSVGFMVVYPYLVLLGILTFLSIWIPREHMPKLVKYYLFFLVVFVLYALVFCFTVASKKYALVDIRSVVLMLLTTWVFVTMRYFFGFEKWRAILLFACKLILVLMLLVALGEITTGWHAAGGFTKKITERGLMDSLMYVPIFLWDNPNTFMVYFILIGMIVTALEPAGKTKDYQTVAFCLMGLVLAVNTESRISQLLIGILAFIYFVYRLQQERKSISWTKIGYVLFVVGAMAYAVKSNVIFKEIPRTLERKVSGTEPRYPAPHASEHQDAALLQPHKVSNDAEYALKDSLALARNSMDERIALLRNGMDFASESSYLGIGPGQYRYRHDQNQVKHNAFGNNGAHFWLIELLSQYGILILTGYVIAIGWVFLVMLRYFKRSPELAIGLLMGLAALFCTSALPSAFLILDINWIFTAVLVIIAAELTTRPKDSVQ